MGEKGAVNADLYLEDGPHNIEALLREQRDVIVFSHATNRHLDVPAGDRARNWAEAEPLIVARFREWEQRGGASGMRRRASDRAAE
jgi:5'(3')-deoxyribonucleotidase